MQFWPRKSDFECMACGYQSPKWMGKCPNCGAWNQMEEIVEKQPILNMELKPRN